MEAFMWAKLLVVFVLLLGLCTAARGDPPQAPAGARIQAAPTSTDYQLQVTWTDFTDEDSYQLVASGSISPGAILTNSGGLGSTWRLVANLSANTTSFIFETVFGQSFGVCALKGQEMTCLGPSNFALPKSPVEPAEVESLTITLRGIDSLRLSWTQSTNTVHSRALISTSGRTIDQILNDVDQTVVFTGLSPNTSYRIEVCVRNQEQTQQNETCRDTTASTLPRAPLAVSSVSVDQSDPVPTARTVSFTYDNRQESAVAGFSLRLIKNEKVVASATLYPPRSSPYGARSYNHKFTELAPFSGYEAWVVPYNQSGVGNSAGVGFTTPALLSAVRTSLSGDSAMVRWSTVAPGEYGIEKRLSSGTWQSIGSYISLVSPQIHSVVIDDVTSAQDVRVTWKLAYLRSQSAPISAVALAAGTPELVHVTAHSRMPAPTLSGLRHTVAFRTTATHTGEYVLQLRSAANQWTTVASIGSTQPSLATAFSANTVYSISYSLGNTIDNPGGRVYRVCRSQLAFQGGVNLLCSAASDQYSSVGLRRFSLN